MSLHHVMMRARMQSVNESLAWKEQRDSSHSNVQLQKMMVAHCVHAVLTISSSISPTIPMVRMTLNELTVACTRCVDHGAHTEC